MLTTPFMTRRLTKEFIEKNGRSPTKDEFIAIQHEAVTKLINNNSVYGICGQGETKMSEIVFKGKPTPTEGQVIELSGKKPNFFGGIKVCCDFKYMTKEMYENFVKQGKKFATLTGQEFDSLEEAGNDLDGDIIVVDGQKYVVDSSTYRIGNNDCN